MFDAVYIADLKNTLAFEYLVFPDSPPYAVVEQTILSKFGPHQNNPSQLVEANANYFLCSHATQRLVTFVLCRHDDELPPVNPVAPFVFLEKLTELMEVYFGAPLTTTKVSANSDTLTLLLHEMLADGTPNVTDFNNLKDLVLLSSFLLKIIQTGNSLASATSKSLGSYSAGPSSSPEPSGVPWRRSKVRYTKNEMFVDVTESVSVILRLRRPVRPANGALGQKSSERAFDSAFYSLASADSTRGPKLVTGHILGLVDFVSHISGTPSLQILLNSASRSLRATQFHRCIEKDTWSRAHALSFIPPDGRSTLMTYEVDLDSLPRLAQTEMLGLVRFSCEPGLGLQANEFELKVAAQKHSLVASIEAVSVEVCAYELGDAEENPVLGIKSIQASRGDFRYKGNGLGEWTLKNVPTDLTATMRGQIRTETDTAARPVWVKVLFVYKGQVPSGLKVDSLKVVLQQGMGDVKPYKGVKYITKAGDYSIRVLP